MKSRFSSSLLVILTILFTLYSCGAPYETQTLFAMDTVVTVSAETHSPDDLAAAAETLAAIENTFSRTREDAEIAVVNTRTESTLSSETEQLLAKALEVSKNTGGAFSPTLGRLTSLWNVTGGGYVPTDEELAAALADCRMQDVSITDGTVSKPAGLQFDLGACVKGYAAEKAIEALKDKGIQNAMINIGGNVAVSGKPQKAEYWRVGVKNPFYPDELLGYITANDGVIAVSGTYERFFEKDGVLYHHIFDPATGFPAASGLKEAAVYAKDGFLADALSTALFVMGEKRASAFYESGVYAFEAILVTDDGRVVVTAGLKERFVPNTDAAFDDTRKLIF